VQSALNHERTLLNGEFFAVIQLILMETLLVNDKFPSFETFLSLMLKSSISKTKLNRDENSVLPWYK